jgi:hypothetical protein
VAILSAVAFTVALGFGLVAPAIPAFARQFDVSVAAAASVISVFALMRVVGALPAGRLVDRFGEPGVMAAGIAVVATSSILAGFSQSFVELLVLRGSGGVGSAMFSISAQALLLGTVPSSQRGRASGLFSGGFLLGGISGPAVGGLVAAWSLRAPFFIYGCLLVVPAILAAVVLRRVPDRRQSSVARSTPRVPAAIAVAAPIRKPPTAVAKNTAGKYGVKNTSGRIWANPQRAMVAKTRQQTAKPMLNGGEGWEIPCQPCLNSSINFAIGIVTSRDQRIQNKANHNGNPGFPRHRPLGAGSSPDAMHRTSSLALSPAGGNIGANKNCAISSGPWFNPRSSTGI